MMCPVCGAFAADDSKFCPVCGNALGAKQEEVKPQPAVTAEAEETPAAAEQPSAEQPAAAAEGEEIPEAETVFQKTEISAEEPAPAFSAQEPASLFSSMTEPAGQAAPLENTSFENVVPAQDTVPAYTPPAPAYTPPVPAYTPPVQAAAVPAVPLTKAEQKQQAKAEKLAGKEEVRGQKKMQPVTTAQAFWFLVVAAIPVVNLIALFVWAFSSRSNLSKRGFARAILIHVVIWLIISILAGIGVLIFLWLNPGFDIGLFFAKNFF